MLIQEQLERPTFIERLQSSFTEVFGGLIPNLLGALVIVFAGYLLAKLVEKGTMRLPARSHSPVSCTE